jgi:crossover junction endodeoxyribonuclease RuvC
MHVMGIDPGTGRCGWAVLDFTNPQKPVVVSYGCFEYPSSLPIPERLVLIEEDITRILKEYKPHMMAIETLLFNRNITTAMSVAEARGVIELCGAKHKVSMFDCSPSQIKMAVTGYGRADKAQIKQMVQLQLKLEKMHKLDDAVDALAIALTGHQISRTRTLTV